MSELVVTGEKPGYVPWTCIFTGVAGVGSQEKSVRQPQLPPALHSPAQRETVRVLFSAPFFNSLLTVGLPQIGGAVGCHNAPSAVAYFGVNFMTVPLSVFVQ
jgi:hypothetical protein